ncbi:MAG: transglycosylase domain-containing protein [Solirubrobacteraceae bacterium]
MSRRERQRRRRRNHGHPFRRVLLMTVLVAVLGSGLGAMGVLGWIVSVADSAPDISQLKPRDPGQVSEVFAGDGSLLGYIASDVLRTVVPNNRLPQTLKNATVSIEDRRFYKHGGVDYQGIVRAGVRDIFSGGTVQGGSTLTMQLVDNVYLPDQIRSHHNIRYKIIQAKLANELEAKHTKSWILDEYLNDVDYGTLGGQTAYGVGAASQLFFNRPVQRLDLAQVALLAGLPQAPSQYNPFHAPGLARRRRREVLRAMAQSHYISVAQADAADASSLQLQPNNVYQVKREPYVFDYVKQQLIQRLGAARVERGGLRVYTTIDLKRQAEARQVILNNEGQPGDPAAALVSIDPTDGHILAMATSSSYGQTSFDYATQAHRQTGSAFKVYVLMTLIHDFDGDPNQTYYNSHELLPGWLPGYPTYHVQTSERSYLGTVSVTKATTLSDNTVFAQLDADLTPEKVTETAHAMGITSHLDSIPAEGIGGLRIGVTPLEMADGYATLASGGYHLSPTIISKVVFPDGSVRDLGDPSKQRVFTDGEAYAADQVLKTVITSGTGTAADYGCPAAGKTGTTSNYTDAWFVGYTPQLSTAVWVGYPNSTISMNDVNGLGPGFGGTLAAPIWHDYMQQASNGFCGDFPSPNNPWHGTPFFGNFATTGNRNSRSFNGNSGNSGNTGSVTTSTTATNPYNNPSLYAHPPQGPPTTPGTTTTPVPGNGNAGGPPPGPGSGHSTTGGAGIKKH